MRYVWLTAAVLIGVACLGLFMAFQNPNFLVGVAGSLGGIAWNALAPKVLKRMPADKEAAWNAELRRNPSARRIDFERKWKREHESG